MAQPTQTMFDKIRALCPARTIAVAAILALVIQIDYINDLKRQIREMKGGSTVGTAQIATGTPDAAVPEAAPATAGDFPDFAKDEFIIGKKDADVKVVLYEDLECYYCNQFHPTVTQLRSEYGDKVAFVFRNFPLTSIHPQAQFRGEAATCAAEQGGAEAVFKLADQYFGAYFSSTIGDLNRVAQAAGLDGAAIQSCIDAGRARAKVARDVSGGDELGVRGTPGTFIVGKDKKYRFISGAQPYATVKASLDAALAG